MRTFKEILAEHPSLSIDGFGYFGTPEVSEERSTFLFNEFRDALIKREDHVLKVCLWLKLHISPIKSVNTKAWSISLRNLIEREIGSTTNGDVIAAALMLGYAFDEYKGDAYFSMSSRSIKRATLHVDNTIKERHESHRLQTS